MHDKVMNGILLVDHGSRRAASNEQLGDMACRVAGLLPDYEITYAHMEIADPSIADGIEYLVNKGVTDIVIMLYFLSDGRHVTKDVPQLVTEAAAHYPQLTWRIGNPLGPCDELAELLVFRARDSFSVAHPDTEHDSVPKSTR